MSKTSSAFDRVKAHLVSQGCDKPAPRRLQDDLELLVRKCSEVRSRGGNYAAVELSPYMASLLRVSSAAAPREVAVMGARAAAGV